MQEESTVTIIPNEGANHFIQVPRKYVMRCKTLADSLEWCNKDQEPIIPILFNKKLMELAFEYIHLSTAQINEEESSAMSSKLDNNIEAWVSRIQLQDLADLCNVRQLQSHILIHETIQILGGKLYQ